MRKIVLALIACFWASFAGAQTLPLVGTPPGTIIWHSGETQGGVQVLDYIMGFSSRGVNFGVANVDYPIIIPINIIAYTIRDVEVTNCSASMGGAVGGLYTAPNQGGTAIVAATQGYGALFSGAQLLHLTLASGANTTRWTVNTLYFNLSTAYNHNPATCDIYVFIDNLT